MAAVDLENTAKALVAGGKGILAADETPQTLTNRFEALKINSTPESRRDYREMFFTTPNIAQYISGVITQDETIHQKSSSGTPLPDVLAKQGIMPGIKVDNGAKTLGGSPEESSHRRSRWFARSPRKLPSNGCAFRQMACSHPYRRRAAEFDLCTRKRTRTGALCGAMPGARSGTYRRA